MQGELDTELVEVAPDFFLLGAELRLAPGFYLASNMAVIRRGTSLWVHSPLPLETGWPELVASLGEVHTLVAPSANHHLYLKAAAGRFPSADTVGPSRLARKRKDLELDAFLEDQRTARWPSGVRAIAVDGAPSASEFLFYDEQSKSLLVTDLLFHNERPRTWLTRAFVRLTSGWDGPKRSVLWRFLVKDKVAFERSLELLSTLEIDRVVPAHGRVIDDTALALALMRGTSVTS